MKIGELSKASGVTPSRIRFYERSGLMRPAERRTNGYRTYPPQALVILDLINRAQQAGFTLDEIRVLLPAKLDQWDYDTLLRALRQKVDQIRALGSRLAHNRQQLVDVISDIEARPDDMDCAANARRVLSRLAEG